MQNMAYHPFQMSDLQNEFNMNLVADVMKAFRERNKGDMIAFGCMQIEEIGGTLVQEAWRDVTGAYIKYRIVPIYSDSLPAQAAARAFGKDFVDIVTSRTKLKGHRESTIVNGATDRDYIAWVHTGSNSIGDLCNRHVTRQKSLTKNRRRL